MTESDLPAPLIAAEVDLRDFDYMPLFGERLFKSDTWIACNAEEKVAALRSWWASWHQEPAGSLPADDQLLADLCGYGVAVAAWRKVRCKALRGWIKCRDGRLYHPVVCEIAEDVWTGKRKRRAENERDRARKRRKQGGVPAETATHSAGKKTGDPPETGGRSAGIPPENALKGREGKGRGREDLQLSQNHLDAARAGAGEPGQDLHELARQVIEAFDQARTAVFGEENQRPWPRPRDHGEAVAMLRGGASLGQCVATFEAVFRRQKAAGERPADTLGYMRNAVADAVRAGLLDIPPLLDKRRANGGAGDAGWEPPPRDPAYVVIARAWDRGNARANGIPMPRLEDYPGPGSDAWEAVCERWQRKGCPVPMPRLTDLGRAAP